VTTYTGADTHLVQQYSANVRMLAQQKESRLLPFIQQETATGERSYFDQYGVHGDMDDVTTRFKDSNFKDPETARRAVDIQLKNDARIVDNFDEMRKLSDMTSSIVMAQGGQAGRTIDTMVLRAALADAKTGKDGTTLVSLPAAQQVAVDDHTYDTGSGDTGLTITKMQRVQELFDEAEVELEDRFIAVDPKSYQNLITDEKASSVDYIDERPFGDQRLTTINQIAIIRLPETRFEKDGSGNIRNVAFARRGLLGVAGQEGLIKAKIYEAEGKEAIGSMVAQVNLCFAATRMEEPAVVEVINKI